MHIHAHGLGPRGGYDALSMLRLPEVLVTGGVTLTTNNLGLLHGCSGTSVDYTITLPAAAQCKGQFLGFRMAASLTKLVTLDGNASETIDGTATRIMWAGETAVLYCNGTSWFKVGGKSIPFSARGARSSDESTINAATWTACTFNTLETGTSLVLSTSNGQFTMPRTGRYIVGWSGLVEKLTGAMTYCLFALGLNGAVGNLGYGEFGTLLTAGGDSRGFMSRPYHGSVGSYFTGCIYTNATTAKFVANQCYMDVVEVPIW